MLAIPVPAIIPNMGAQGIRNALPHQRLSRSPRSLGPPQTHEQSPLHNVVRRVVAKIIELLGLDSRLWRRVAQLQAQP